jgi:hypothetical protein
MKPTLTTAAILLLTLTLAGPAAAQSPTLIYACVDPQGRPTIIAPGGTCGTRDRLLTWPAAPTAPVTFYQRVSAPQPVAQAFVTAIALCDAPEDVATGGGFQLNGTPIEDSTSTVVTSTSCVASGLCGGATGQDGWVVVAKSTNVAAQGTQITASSSVLSHDQCAVVTFRPPT